jgi:hypothetical protein
MIKPTTYSVNELEWSHVGSASRPVDREETQSGSVQSVQVMEGVSEQLACFLGGCIWRHGTLNRVVFA